MLAMGDAQLSVQLRDYKKINLIATKNPLIQLETQTHPLIDYTHILTRSFSHTNVNTVQSHKYIDLAQPESQYVEPRPF